MSFLDSSVLSVKSQFRKFLSTHDPGQWIRCLKDPRNDHYVQRDFSGMMTGFVKALMSGATTLRGIEIFSELCGERIPDTTLFDTIRRVDSTPLEAALARQVKEAHRSHVIGNELPFHVIAVDGKMQATTKRKIDAGSQWRKTGFYANRVLRAMHVSGKVPYLMAQVQIPAIRNDGSAFKLMVEKLEEHYGNTDLLNVFTMDAGFTYKRNAALLDSKGHKYLMAVKSNSGELYKAAFNATHCHTCDAIKAEEKGDDYTIRHLFLGEISVPGWPSAVTAIRQEKYRVNIGGNLSDTETRIFISNIPIGDFNNKVWLELIRRHWRIENNGFFNLDYSFVEDDRPICNYAMGLIGLIRMMLANFFAHFVAARLKANDMKRYFSWTNLMEVIRFVFYEEHILKQHGLARQ